MGKINLSKLTKDQKLRLLDLLEEKKRRIRERKAAYVPNTGQLPVHQSSSEERFVFAGNGGGKSALCANEAIWWMNGHNEVTKEFTPVPAKVIVVLSHPDKVADQWLPELQKWTTIKPEHLHKRGKPYVNSITNDLGSELVFMFHQADPMAYESIEADAVVIDEPCPRHIFISLKRSLRKKGRTPKILFVGTPIAGSWLRKEVHEPWTKGERPDTECFKFGTIVNEKNLAEGYIESFSRALSDKEKRIRLDGDFYDLDGLALAHLLDHQVHFIEPIQWDRENWPCVIAIDPHPSKAHHAIMLGCDRDGYLHVIKEMRAKVVPRQFATLMKKFMEGFRVIDIVSDSLGSSEGTGGEGFKSFIQVLNEEGIRARATNWEEKNDEDFISRIQEALVIPEEPNNFGQRIPQLRVWKHCIGLRGDLESVCWVKHKNIDENKPKLEIQNKDFLSCLKYALATNLTPNKHKAKIYTPKAAPTSYGINKPSASKLVWRRRLTTRR